MFWQGQGPPSFIVYVCVSHFSCEWLFCNPMDCSLPGSSVHRILQARILEWVATPFSRGSYWPKDWTQVSCTAGGFLTVVSHQRSPINTCTHAHINIYLSNDSMLREFTSSHTDRKNQCFKYRGAFFKIRAGFFISLTNPISKTVIKLLLKEAGQIERQEKHTLQRVEHDWMTEQQQSLTQWAWVRANSGRWWWTEKPSVLQLMGSQGVRHDLVTKQQVQTILLLNWWVLATSSFKKGVHDMQESSMVRKSWCLI